MTGIPVEPEFAKPVDRAAVLAEYGLRDDVPLLLVAAGTLGLSPALAVARRLLELDRPFQALVLCGKNEGLRADMEALLAGRGDKFRTLGYSPDMPRLMGAASLLLSKPGGMTTAESLARGLPMVTYWPGQ